MSRRLPISPPAYFQGKGLSNGPSLGIMMRVHFSTPTDQLHGQDAHHTPWSFFGSWPQTRLLNVSCNSLTCLSRFAILAIARLIQHIDSGTFFYYSRLWHWLHLLYGGDSFANIILPQNTTRGCAISRAWKKRFNSGPLWTCVSLHHSRPHHRPAGRKSSQKTPSFDVQRSTAQGGRKAVWSHSIGSGSA